MYDTFPLCRHLDTDQKLHKPFVDSMGMWHDGILQLGGVSNITLMQ